MLNQLVAPGKDFSEFPSQQKSLSIQSSYQCRNQYSI